MSTTKNEKYDGFTAAERDAMKERAKELKSRTRRGAKPDTEGDVLAKIAEMSDGDRVLAERLHAVVRTYAPALTSKLWYGMPAYVRDGRIVFFFQSAAKFKARYATLGFSDEANLDDGVMWPTSFALTERTFDDESKIGELLRQAVS